MSLQLMATEIGDRKKCSEKGALKQKEFCYKYVENIIICAVSVLMFFFPNPPLFRQTRLPRYIVNVGR